ncbi:MAG TPA: class I SAM-dependent methyltransferase [bacterium]|nr:class I SAM-dependent methyltransferase [bacterium]HEX67913.1 class I SAM-dependent methyltransferase [bacterium]
MKIISYRDREEKLRQIGEVCRKYLRGRVLDLGCDVKTLKKFVVGEYMGVDIMGTPDVKVNLEEGLPFSSDSFDTVIAIDVLEHLENLHNLFDEICRVSRRYALIGLPNVYEWHFRMLFLMGRNISGKYGLPPEKKEDRHRWIFTLEESRRFLRERGGRKGWEVIEEIYGFYRYRTFFPVLVNQVGKFLCHIGLGRNLYPYHYLAVMRKKKL